jgi:hypothetical protein
MVSHLLDSPRPAHVEQLKYKEEEEEGPKCSWKHGHGDDCEEGLI